MQVELRDLLPRLGVEDEQTRRQPAADENAMIGFIQRHGKIGGDQAERPFAGGLLFVPVRDRDVVCSQHIDENPRLGFFQLERLWMRPNRDIAHGHIFGGVDDADRPAAVPDVNLYRRRVVAHIVGIVVEFNTVSGEKSVPS